MIMINVDLTDLNTQPLEMKWLVHHINNASFVRKRFPWTWRETETLNFKSTGGLCMYVCISIFLYFVSGCCLLTGLTKQEKHYKYCGGQRLQEWGHFPSLQGSNYCCAPMKCPQIFLKQVLTIYAFTIYVWTTANVGFDSSAMSPMIGYSISEWFFELVWTVAEMFVVVVTVYECCIKYTM